MGVAPLTITPSDPLVTCFFPILETLDSAGPEVLLNKEEMLLLEEKAMAPLNWKLTASWPLWVPHASKSTDRERDYCGLG